MTTDELKALNLPRHVVITMDGNRRWAAAKGASALVGHQTTVESVIEKLITRAGELEIPYLTFWVWTTENWSRPKNEVSGIIRLFRWALGNKVKKFISQGARLKIIGDISAFPKDIQQGLCQAAEMSAGNTAITVTFAINYGGRDELVRSIKKLVRSISQGTVSPDDICEQTIAQFLDTADMPDPDLLIRPGGEQRLSGLMPWQSVYSELYFTKTLMPDFSPDEFDKAILDYTRRNRRFGGGSFTGQIAGS